MPYVVLPLPSIRFYVKLWHSSCAYQNMIHVRSFASVLFQMPYMLHPGIFSNAIHGSVCAKYHILCQIVTQFLCIPEHDPCSFFCVRAFSNAIHVASGHFFKCHTWFCLCLVSYFTSNYDTVPVPTRTWSMFVFCVRAFFKCDVSAQPVPVTKCYIVPKFETRDFNSWLNSCPYIVWNCNFW